MTTRVHDISPEGAAADPEISVVVPIFNEEQTLHELRGKIADALAGEDYEIVLVDDGSRDRKSTRLNSSHRT